MSATPRLTYTYKDRRAQRLGLYAPLFAGDVADIVVANGAMIDFGDSQSRVRIHTQVKCLNSGTMGPFFGKPKYLITTGTIGRLSAGNFLQADDLAAAQVLGIKSTTLRNRLLRSMFAVRSAFKFFPAIG
jgi:hypothetical protein